MEISKSVIRYTASKEHEVEVTVTNDRVLIETDEGFLVLDRHQLDALLHEAVIEENVERVKH